jgi:hypothetical protein
MRKASREAGAEEHLSRPGRGGHPSRSSEERPGLPSRREVLVAGAGVVVAVGAGASCSVPGLPTPTSACVAADPARVAASRIACRSRYCRYFRAGVSDGIGVCSGIPCV